MGCRTRRGNPRCANSFQKIYSRSTTTYPELGLSRNCEERSSCLTVAERSFLAFRIVSWPETGQLQHCANWRIDSFPKNNSAFVLTIFVATATRETPHASRCLSYLSEQVAHLRQRLRLEKLELDELHRFDTAQRALVMLVRVILGYGRSEYDSRGVRYLVQAFFHSG